MSILSELQSRKLGLIELMSMGFDVYLKNLKPILLVFCTIYLPFLIIFSAFVISLENNSSPSGLFWILYCLSWIILTITSLIYFIAISVITENYVYGINTNYHSVIKKIFLQIFHLFFLSFRFGINYFLRAILLLIPGIIYLINNQYYGLAFILRDKRGKAAFAYSRSIVKDNWWRVFFFVFLFGLIPIFLQRIFNQLLSIIMNSFWAYLLSQTLISFIGIGIGLGGILLFFNLEFLKNMES